MRQVIGKALEEGVLRKEDEIKYEKILPKISDSPQLVKSKIESLDTSLRQRKSTHLDALEDAGFEVGRFRARAPHGKGAPPAGETPEQRIARLLGGG